MLVDLMSRWMTAGVQSWWRYMSPLAAPSAILHRRGQSSSGRPAAAPPLASRRSAWCMLPRGMYSYTMKWSSPRDRQACSLRMFRCRTLPRMAISAAITCAALPFHSRFTATTPPPPPLRSSRYTRPVPPDPIRFSSPTPQISSASSSSGWNDSSFHCPHPSPPCSRSLFLSSSSFKLR
uniref:Uncharacterized protein n=1 Tax=Arundo donax TaxID=35708 RepID=A0A0A9E4X6_ARUDO